MHSQWDQNHTLVYSTLLFLLHQLEEFHRLFPVLSSSLDHRVERVAMAHQHD
ncbi:hypothetical protein PG996_002991 [Apiospora saccharicola]|uniref:Uncharacterized protein n=1 Tax=Apiospora saccharicola TaxID=335842 RepID=A0ABR1W2K8_9PEZI